MPLSLLGEIVALFVVSVLIAYICYRIRLVPIAGFLIAGVLIGPGALGLMADVDLIYNLAEVGVILLLFTLGAEFSLEKLSRIKRFIVVGGGLQVSVLVLLVTGALAAFGIGWRVGVFTGFLVVLSSTAIVLKLFHERAETDTPMGQVSLALLIFQDLAMVMMVLLVPILSGGGSIFAIAFALVKAAVVIALVIILARRAFPWLLEKIAHTRREELFLLTVVTVCFGTAWLTSLFGVSLALGAFLAGLVVSESRYSGYALSEMLPLRTVFNAIFFVSIGMLLDLGFFVANLAPVLAVAAGVLLLKFVVTAGTVLALGYPIRIAAVSGLALAQICESSFVLERAGAAVGLSPAGLGHAGEQIFIAVAVLLMVLTPFMMQAGPRLGDWMSGTSWGRRLRRGEPEVDRDEELENHVIVVGYGPAGQWMVEALQANGIPFLIVELNLQTVKRLEGEGLPILYGDASRPHLLDVAGIARAKLCVVAINDPSAVHHIVQLARFLNPTVQIIVRARFLSDVDGLRQAGADVVVPEELETSLRLSSHVLEAYLVPEERIRLQVEALRSREPLVEVETGGDGPASAVRALEEEGLQTRTVAVRAGSVAAGRSLADLDLEATYGVTVLAKRRGRHTEARPGGASVVEPGDRLVIFGTAEQFAACGHLFRTTEGRVSPRRHRMMG